ncbi:MAG TPA: peptide chain release factor N(5)-glutamine methyltransferase [Solirubrobacteraceae bacterium]|nr:peptide chain release factor N(5)-glutamine methyltransferase [Solirubrobacteraceae bacterium]
MGPFAGTPVREALDSALVALQGARIDTPRLDAEVLLAHAMGVSRTKLYTDPDAQVEGEAATKFRDFVRRRTVEREPVAYIVGRKGFRRIELDVDQRVLVPRPETELLVEAGLELPQGSSVVDVGTGSGAIALALKEERPSLNVTGTDISEDALAVARGNARRLGLDVTFVQADLFDGDFDAVISNPPYVAADERLPPEVGHEPRGALFGGDDGLDVVRRLVARCGEGTSIRFVALEIGEGQADATAALLSQAAFARVEIVKDLARIERVVIARR